MTTAYSILSITNPSQLADFCAVIIPCIWAGSFKRALLSPKRHAAFKVYVQKVLKATQISCTCMILALHYIQRLRAAYPSIRASIGSEVRLFTTALVLANKYLDDNTFTNKVISHNSFDLRASHLILYFLADMVRGIQHSCQWAQHHGDGVPVSIKLQHPHPSKAILCMDIYMSAMVDQQHIDDAHVASNTTTTASCCGPNDAATEAHTWIHRWIQHTGHQEAIHGWSGTSTHSDLQL